MVILTVGVSVLTIACMKVLLGETAELTGENHSLMSK